MIYNGCKFEGTDMQKRFFFKELQVRLLKPAQEIINWGKFSIWYNQSGSNCKKFSQII